MSKTPIILELRKPVVSLVWLPQAVNSTAANNDELIAQIARISTSQSGKNPKILYDAVFGGEIKVSHDPNKPTDNGFGGHFSVPAVLSLGVMIKDISRSAAAQLLRHAGGNSFQEFSQRYANVLEKGGVLSISQFFEPLKAGDKPRNGTREPLDLTSEQMDALLDAYKNSGQVYDDLVARGCSLETARGILPLFVTTDLYVNFNLRSLITMLMQRLFHKAQDEIRLIANQLKDLVIQHFPALAASLDNFRFWSVIKGDDIMAIKRYSQPIAALLGIYKEHLVPLIIAASNLDYSTASPEERGAIEGAKKLYKDKIERMCAFMELSQQNLQNPIIYAS